METGTVGMNGIPTIGENAEYFQRPSGLIVPEKYKRPYPTCIDLFCGCGGFSLGFIQAGFEVVAAIDNDCTSMHTYMNNLGSYPINIHYTSKEDEEQLVEYFEKDFEKTVKGKTDEEMLSFYTSGSGWMKNNLEFPPVRNVWFGDIRQLKGQDILKTLGLEQGELDCVIGSPPCQGFSRANSKRKATDTRNNLVFEYARMILELQPKTFVFENVPGILSMVTPEGLPVIDVFCQIIADGGFGTVDGIKKMLLRSAGCGAALSHRQSKRQQESKKEPMKEPMEAGVSLF